MTVIRHIAQWTAWTLAAAACLTAGYYGLSYAAGIPWTAPISIRGAFALVAALVAPLYGWAFWTAHHREQLTERAARASDDADRALAAMGNVHERIDAVADRQDVIYNIATAARRELTALGDEYGAHRHPVHEPATDPMGRAVHPPTAPRPAVDAVAGGARVTAQPAAHPSGRGRHAAPDTGTFDAVRHEAVF